MLRFYWSLGRDIVALKAEARWGDKFMKNLSRDLKRLMPDATCFSETNLKYMKYFYLLYQPITPQPEEQSDEQKQISPQLGDKLEDMVISPQLGDKMTLDIFREGELVREAAVKEYLRAQKKRYPTVQRKVAYYNLDVIIITRMSDLG